MTFHKNFVAVIKVNGKVLREERNSSPTVYLPFGSEYSILLKNLFTRKALVKVSIDGQDILNGNGLIVDANSEFELERFINDSLSTGNKLKFIEKTDEISDYRGDRVDDGIVRIEYQFEKEKPPIWYNYSGYFNQPYGNDGRIGSNNYYTSRRIDSSANNVVYSTSFTSNSKSDMVFDASINDSGITVQGSESKQSFSLGSIDTLESQKYVITLMLKGKTKETAPVVAPVIITKIKCNTCGRTYTGTPKFCSNCGTSLKIF